MAISKFNNKYKYKTFINKNKINKSKIIRKFSKKKSNIIKIQKGGAGTEPKNISEIKDEYLTGIRQIIEGILDKETSKECQEPKISKITKKEIILYSQLDNAYILDKINLIPILNYFNDTPEQKRKNINDYFAPFIIETLFNVKDTYKTYKIKYNNKCYDIDRWKIYFDSNNLFKDFLSTKTNFDNIAKEAKNIFDKTEDSKKLEDINEIEFLDLIKPIYIDLKKRFKSIIPIEFTEKKLLDLDKDIPIFGWNYYGCVDFRVAPIINNNEIREFNAKYPNIKFNILDIIYNISKLITKTKNILFDYNNPTKQFNGTYKGIDFMDIFKELIDNINDIETKNIEYYFDSSNKNIIELRNSKLDNNKLKNLKKLFKVFPESYYDIYDHKDDPDKAIGTLNIPIIEISLKKDSEIKILTYKIDKNLKKPNALNVRKILKQYLEVDKVDFICLQDFNYYDKKIINNNVLFDNFFFEKDTSGAFNKKLYRNKDNYILNTLNNIDNIDNINKNILINYNYIYNNNNFIFYKNISIKKYNIDPNFNYPYDDIILRINDGPNIITIVLFKDINKNILLINVLLNENLTNDEINIIINKNLFDSKLNNEEEEILDKIIKLDDKDKNKKYYKLKEDDKKIVEKFEINKIKNEIINAIKTARIIMVGNFNRTIYSNKNKDTYYSNDPFKGKEIDNSAYGLKLFEGLFENNFSTIMYNIPENDKIFSENTCCFKKDTTIDKKKGHIDNVLDNYGLQTKYEYYKTETPCDNLPVLVTLLDANPIDNFNDIIYLKYDKSIIGNNPKIMPPDVIGYGNNPKIMPPDVIGYGNFPDRLPRVNDHVSLIKDPSKQGIVTHVENGKPSTKYPNPCNKCYITVKFENGKTNSSLVKYYDLIIFGYANDPNREPQIGDEVELELKKTNKIKLDVGNSVVEKGKVFEIKDSELTSIPPASKPPCNNCNIIVQSLTKKTHKGAPISAKYYNFIKSSPEPKKTTNTNTSKTSKTPKISYCYS